jgi:membrane-associated phospholipid phosphatase
MKEIFYDFLGLNKSAFYMIYNFCSEYGLQKPLMWISNLFNIEMFGALYIIAVIAGYIVLLKKKDLLSKYYDFMAKLGITYGLFGLTFAALKFGINLKRPFCSTESIHTIIDISSERCESSFPSSHTGLAFLLLLSLWPCLKGRFWAKSFFGALFLTAALSRIALAMHYPADIFYSIIVTCFVMFIANLIYKLFEGNVIKWVKGRLL